MTSQRILIVTSEFPPGPGGIGQHACSMATGLAKNGHSVRVLAGSDYASEEQILAFDRALEDVRVTRIPRTSARYLYRFSLVRSLLAEEPVDVVISTGKFPVWMNPWLRRKVDRVVSIVHGTEAQLPRTWERWLYRKGLLSSSRIVPVSQFTLGLIDADVRDAIETQIVPNGILPLELDIIEGCPPGTKLRGDPAMLTVGNVSRRKGQHRVIRALPAIRNTFPNIHYHCVGLPTLRDECLSLAKKLGVADAVTFHGRADRREDLLDFYRRADLFVMLSENQADGDVEGFGISILEANYFGLPAIGALGCGIEDAIEDGTAGFLVEGDAPEDITQAIQKVLDNHGNFARAAKAWARSFDWSSLSQKILG